MALPTAPTGLTATSRNLGARLSWTAPSSGTPLGYTVSISPETPAAAVWVTGTTAYVSGLVNGTTYGITVAAFNEEGTGPASDSVSVTPSVGVVASPPTGVVGVAGNQDVTVSWTPPASDGGSQLSYVVTPTPATPGATIQYPFGENWATVTGLTPGQAYTFTVFARNAAGDGPPSEPSNTVNTPQLPMAPGSVVATPGVKSASLSWVASVSDAPVLFYTVTVYPTTPGAQVIITGTTASVTGLADASDYTFTVRATSAVGEGPESSHSPQITTAGVPGAPSIVSVAPADRSVLLDWNPPASDGGNAITAYAVTVSPVTPSAAAIFDGSSATVTGLSNGTAYTFRVSAINGVGEGPLSTSSPSVIPVTVPGPPTLVIATAGIRSANLSWTAPTENGGSALTGYTVEVTPATPDAGVTITGTTASITNLANSTAYSFTVSAVSAAGTSAPSAASAQVSTPGLPGKPTITSATAGYRSAVVTWTAPTDTGGRPITSYAIEISPPAPGASILQSDVSATISGLADGIGYRFRVNAITAVGETASDLSAIVYTFGVPTPPLNVLANAGGAAVSVTWDLPAFDGGSPITGYVVTSNPETPGSVTTIVGRTATVSGLTPGAVYTFRVFAKNFVGDGSFSVPSNAVIPIRPPGAPSNVAVTSYGIRTVSLSWSAPTDDGGSSVTGYAIVITPPDPTAVIVYVGRTAVVSHLANDTAYTFQVAAINAAGTGTLSSPSELVRTPGVPDPPTNVAAVVGVRSASLTWTPPDYDGDRPLTGYAVVTHPQTGASAAIAGTEAFVTGLANDTEYTFAVLATNMIGASVESAPSNLVRTPAAPGAPTDVLADVSIGHVDLVWNPPADTGGKPITGYVVTVTPVTPSAHAQVAGTTATVTGLIAGVEYTFRVTALTIVGPSVYSAPSNPVTPTTSLPAHLAPLIVNVAPSDTTDLVRPGKPLHFGLKSLPAAVQLGTLHVALGMSDVRYHGLSPDEETVPEGVKATLDAVEGLQPALAPISISINHSGNLVLRKDSQNDFERGVYTINFPAKDYASSLGYIKFKKKAWATGKPDWCFVDGVVGLYFGFRHGTYNTSVHVTLQDDGADGVLLVSGPLQAFRVPRPLSLQVPCPWKTLTNDSSIEVWIYFNEAGEEPPFNPPYTTTIEVWVKMGGQTYTFGPYPRGVFLEDPTREPDDDVSLYVGNVGKAGDVLELEDWVIYPDFRKAVRDGVSLPFHALRVVPDSPLVYRASENNLPNDLFPGRWYRPKDAGAVEGLVYYGYQPGKRSSPLSVTLDKFESTGDGVELPANGHCVFERIEPILLNRQDGFYVEALMSGNSDIPEGDVFGGGFLVDDGDTQYAAVMLEMATRRTYGLARPGSQVQLASYLDTGTTIDYTTMRLVRLICDRHRKRVIFEVDDEKLIDLPFAEADLRPSAHEDGRIRFGHVVDVRTKGQFQLSQMTIVPSLLSVHGQDEILPDAANAPVPFTLAQHGNGIAEIGETKDPGGGTVLRVTKTEHAYAGTHYYYTRALDAEEVRGAFLEFRARVVYYESAGGTPAASNTTTGAAVNLYFGTKVLSLGFYDCGAYGKMLAVLPEGDLGLQDIIEQTPRGKLFSARCPWGEMVTVRAVVRPFNDIKIWIGNVVNDPAITIPWRGVVDGWEIPVSPVAPSIAFGHFTGNEASSTEWDFLRWGVSKGYEITVAQDYRDGIQDYLFNGKLLYRVDFDDGVHE